MASDDLRARVDAAIRPNLLIGLQDAELYDEPGTERINEWADWISRRIADLVRPELDRLARERDDARTACRSAAVLLRSVADEGSDPGTLLQAARALDDVAGPAVNKPVITPVTPDTTAGSGCWYCGCTATGDDCTCDHSKPTTTEET